MENVKKDYMLYILSVFPFLKYLIMVKTFRGYRLDQTNIQFSSFNVLFQDVQS